MATQEDLTAFANKFGLYIDIRPCGKCLNSESDNEHGFDCDEYKTIYEWVENRVRQQIAGEHDEKLRFCSNCSKTYWTINFDNHDCQAITNRIGGE